MWRHGRLSLVGKTGTDVGTGIIANVDQGAGDTVGGSIPSLATVMDGDKGEPKISSAAVRRCRSLPLAGRFQVAKHSSFLICLRGYVCKPCLWRVWV